MQNIIVQQVKLIDRTLSGLITGTNINLTDQNQANRLISNGTHQATSFPVAYNNQHTLNPHGMMSSRKVEKRVQKRDPLGNPLWKSDGKPQLTTILVDEDVQSAQVSFTQSELSNSPLVDQNTSQGKYERKEKNVSDS